MKIYESIFPCGGKDAVPGVAPVGGTFAQPNLGLSYLFAARLTLEAAASEGRLRDAALPTVYLQRHALEVALKHLLETAYDVLDDAAWLRLLEQDASADRPSPDKTVPNVHDFDPILSRLRDALVAIGYPRIPAEIEAVVARVRELERVMSDEEARLQKRRSPYDASRWRYATLTDGRRSFPELVDLHVEEHQELLEDLFAKFFVYEHEEYENPNLTTDLAHEGRSVEEKIVAIVGFNRWIGEEVVGVDGRVVTLDELNRM